MRTAWQPGLFGQGCFTQALHPMHPYSYRGAVVKEKPPRWRRAVHQCLGFLAKADKVSVMLGYFAHDIGEIGLD